MTQETNYDVTTFIKNYLSMTVGDEHTTDEGNPQPVLVASAFAFDPPVQNAHLPLSFYLSVNTAFSQIDKNLVAFPTSMFDTLDVCVMDKDLFEGVMSKTVTDGEAELSIDNADVALLSRIKEELKAEEA